MFSVSTCSSIYFYAVTEHSYVETHLIYLIRAYMCLNMYICRFRAYLIINCKFAKFTLFYNTFLQSLFVLFSLIFVRIPSNLGN